MWSEIQERLSPGRPVPVPGINGGDAYGVTDAWLSPDERRIYYVTNETGQDEIYTRAQ